MTKYYAIKNKRIFCEIDVAPFSATALDYLCLKEGYDGWIEFEKEGALVLMGIR